MNTIPGKVSDARGWVTEIGVILDDAITARGAAPSRESDTIKLTRDEYVDMRAALAKMDAALADAQDAIYGPDRHRLVHACGRPGETLCRPGVRSLSTRVGGVNSARITCKKCARLVAAWGRG